MREVGPIVGAVAGAVGGGFITKVFISSRVTVIVGGVVVGAAGVGWLAYEYFK